MFSKSLNKLLGLIFEDNKKVVLSVNGAGTCFLEVDNPRGVNFLGDSIANSSDITAQLYTYDHTIRQRNFTVTILNPRDVIKIKDQYKLEVIYNRKSDLDGRIKNERDLLNKMVYTRDVLSDIIEKRPEED